MESSTGNAAAGEHGHRQEDAAEAVPAPLGIMHLTVGAGEREADRLRRMAVQEGHDASQVPPVRNETVRHPAISAGRNDVRKPGMQEGFATGEARGHAAKQVPGVVERPFDEGDVERLHRGDVVTDAVGAPGDCSAE